MSVPAKVAAFFDLDGTLLAPPSLEWRFLVWLLGRDEISGGNFGRWVADGAKTIWRDRRAAIEGNKLYLAGLPESLAADWMSSGEQNSPPYYVEGLARLTWHHAQRHRLFLVTGTLAPLARAIVCRFAWPVEVVATEPEVFDGHWTGWLAGDHMSRETKARSIRMLAAQHGLDLSECFAYGNHADDIPMLQSFGHAVAVNPSWRLARAARRRRWQICRWHESCTSEQMARAGQLAPKEAR